MKSGKLSPRMSDKIFQADLTGQSTNTDDLTDERRSIAQNNNMNTNPSKRSL